MALGRLIMTGVCRLLLNIGSLGFCWVRHSQHTNHHERGQWLCTVPVVDSSFPSNEDMWKPITDSEKWRVSDKDCKSFDVSYEVYSQCVSYLHTVTNCYNLQN